jgi:large subunit ribosomal protein L14
MFCGKKIRCCDNSGVKVAKCLHFFKVKRFRPGNLVVISIKKFKRRKQVSKGQVCRSILVRSNKFKMELLGGHVFFCDTNAIVVMKPNGDLLGNRVWGPVSRLVSKLGMSRLYSVSRALF